MSAAAAKRPENETLLIPAPNLSDSGPYEVPEPREMNALQSYAPEWLEAPRFKRIATIVSVQVIAEAVGQKRIASDIKWRGGSSA